jgi:hypothetical protein
MEDDEDDVAYSVADTYSVVMGGGAPDVYSVAGDNYSVVARDNGGSLHASGAGAGTPSEDYAITDYAAWLREASEDNPKHFVELIIEGHVPKLLVLMKAARERWVEHNSLLTALT